MYLSSSTGFDPLEKTSLIVPALNKHDYGHRFGTCIIAVTAAKSGVLTGYPESLKNAVLFG
jgi:hypothetical protein